MEEEEKLLVRVPVLLLECEEEEEDEYKARLQIVHVEDTKANETMKDDDDEVMDQRKHCVAAVSLEGE